MLSLFADFEMPSLLFIFHILFCFSNEKIDCSFKTGILLSSLQFINKIKITLRLVFCSGFITGYSEELPLAVSFLPHFGKSALLMVVSVPHYYYSWFLSFLFHSLHSQYLSAATP